MSQTKQWKRSAIEGLVVVASILLAFGIDAAWDARQERAAVEVHLEALSLEVGALRVQAEGGIARRTERMEVMRTLLDQTGRGAQSLPNDSINSLVGRLWGAWDPLPPLAALDNLHASGTFPSIGSDELRLGLARLEGVIEQAALHDGRVLRAWEEGLRPYLVANSDARPQVARRSLGLTDYESRFSRVPDELLRDVAFQNHLIVRMNRTVSALGAANTLVDQLAAVSDLIEKELVR